VAGISPTLRSMIWLAAAFVAKSWPERINKKLASRPT
jgi:hypothetical protein